MPYLAGRPCAHRGCVALLHGRGVRFCPEHLAEARRAQDARRGTAAQRGYDARWTRLRTQFLKAHPICVKCGRLATIAHHIIRRQGGGSDDEANLMALCAACHAQIHVVAGELFGAGKGR